MTSASSRTAPLRKRSLRPKKAIQPPTSGHQIKSFPPQCTSSSSSTTDIKKPMRPLTAYHIFFQIEREYIIQTTAGPVADKSMHDNKSYLPDVPRRYRCIKLLPDWFAGPGKRKKRKHRKSHGKIGFFELSQAISKRWATLSTTDPETKRYVTMIAARELDEYKLEMKQFKELTEVAAVPPHTPAEKSAETADTTGAMISPTASPTIRPIEVSSSCVPPMIPTLDQPEQYIYSGSADLFPDLIYSTSSANEDEIDYSICNVSNNGHFIPSPPASPEKINMIDSDGTICDPLFELEGGCSIQQAETRCVSPVLSGKH